MTKPIDTDAHAETPTKPKHMNPQQTLNTKVKSESWRCP
ncbi:hypothetical protein SEA_BOBAPHETT_92 [Mycobacterium phage BobaPhett]|uniref:Uncharacterized protein n=1 Tax=Mycobacterium phage BobaPhett TaxID=2182393 RepID=A0A2U8UMD1_9CAUD|nr:hypothetical protein I5H16_gp092 [Mycobacterium phage BobaPhett]AWN04904.1 hypothetical protein SEA_BOBAPHETT_92 [Mycobacterium phage BobaPhett]